MKINIYIRVLLCGVSLAGLAGCSDPSAEEFSKNPDLREKFEKKCEKVAYDDLNDKGCVAYRSYKTERALSKIEKLVNY